MKKIAVSAIRVRDVPFVMEELNPEDIPTNSNPQLSLKVRDVVLSITLSDIQELKALIHKGERHLLLRQEQALKSRNYVLDL